MDARLGSRLRLGAHTGTLKYIGSVPGTSGTWYGVDWDDPARGKHDGKQLFSTHSSTSGSFIRPSPSISWGRSFLDAFLDKYREPLHLSDAPETVVLGSSNGAVQVEAVNLDKVRRKLADFTRLRHISLDDALLESPGPSGEILSTVPNVLYLDLSRNLFNDWHIVAHITIQLSHLETLALNGNQFQPISAALPEGAFARLRELYLNSTLVPWPEVIRLLPHFPSLSLLEAGYNDLESLSLCSGVAHKLQSLNLDSNKLHSWLNVVESLGVFPSLQMLVVSGNTISSIDDHVPGKNSIPTLVHLSISQNLLQSWRDIDNLGIWCPGLKVLNIADNPIMRSPQNRQLMIARLASLVSLNSSPITLQERIDCERFYLNLIAKECTGHSEDSIIKSHPRWKALCDVHGRPSTSRVPTVPNNLGSRLFEIKLIQSKRKPTANEVKGLEGTTIKLLPTMTLSTLRMKVCKALGIPVARHSLIDLYLVYGNDQGGGLLLLDMNQPTKTAELLGVDIDSVIVAVMDG